MFSSMWALTYSSFLTVLSSAAEAIDLMEELRESAEEAMSHREQG